MCDVFASKFAGAAGEIAPVPAPPPELIQKHHLASVTGA